MGEVIATGKTVEEATENGCRELGLGRDEVSVEILEMPAKKLFKTTPASVRVTALEDDAAPVPQKAQPAPVPQAPPVQQAPQAPQAPQVAKPQAARQSTENGSLLPEEPEVLIDLDQSPHVRQAVEYLGSIFAAAGAENVKLTAYQQGEATLLRAEGGDIAEKLEVRGEVIQALSYLVDRSVNAGVDKKEANYLRIRLDIAGYRNRREGELVSLANRTAREVARTGRSRTLAPMNPYERLIVHTAVGSIEGVVSESIGADTERRVVIKSTAPNATQGDDWKPPAPRGRGGSNQGRSSGSRDRNRGGDRGGRGGAPRRDRDGGGFQKSNTPQREYADRPRDADAAPMVPKRRDAISDGDDLPLYGKIEL